MITKVDNIQSVGIGFKYPTEFFGLSTDTKPTDTANGSVFTEIDSGKKYMFDFAGGQWCEIPAAESGGGGLPEVSASDNGDVLTVVEGAWAKAAPSGGGVLVCNLDTQTGALDKTWQELHDADFAVVKADTGSEQQNMPVSGTGVSGDDYILICTSFTINDGEGAPFYYTFIATSADGYPVAQMG